MRALWITCVARGKRSTIRSCSPTPTSSPVSTIAAVSIANWNKFIERAHATGTGLALVLADVDEFKGVNDTHGHAAGDAVLKGIGRVITDCVRNSDLPCRFGGDEFAIVLTEIEPEQAMERAEAIRSRVDGLIPIPANPEITSSTSIGGTMLHAGESSAELFDRADKQLYQAKDQGRNRVCWSQHSAALAALTSS